MDALINAVNRTEDLVIAIYNQLISVNLKQYLNELKEALIKYRLSLGERDSLFNICQEKLKCVKQEIKESEDFNENHF